MSLLKNALFWPRLSTVVNYLYSVHKDGKDGSLPISSCTSYSLRFRAYKLLFYSLTFQAVLRIFYLSTFEMDTERTSVGKLMAFERNPLPLLLSPVTVTMLQVYSFISPSTIRCTCVISFAGLYLDYALTFKLDNGQLLALLYQFLIENRRRFLLLNGRRLGWSKMTEERERKKGKRCWWWWWWWWKLATDYLSLARQIWTASSDRPASLRFHSQQLSFYSAQLRARMIIYVAAAETLVLLAFVFISEKFCTLYTVQK